jgi:hypothetical protein
LNAFPLAVVKTLEGFCDDKWALVVEQSTNMFVSREKHQAWVFRRT